MPPLAIPLGLLIGLALGALGGGGSILTVPVLVYALDQDPLTATSSSLVIVGLTSLLGLLPHARAGRVRLGAGLLFGALGAAGSYAGSSLASQLPAHVLLAAFAGLLLVMATLMLRQQGRNRAGGPGGAEPAAGGQDRGDEDPTAQDPTAEPMLTLHPLGCACPRVAKVVVTATAVGLLTGFFGVGGGFVLVPALVLALAFPMPVAVGTSMLVIAVNSATALAARVGAGGSGLDWGLIGVVTAAAVAGSLLAGHLASRVDPHRLVRAFAVLLVTVAVYTATRSVIAML